MLIFKGEKRKTCRSLSIISFFFLTTNSKFQLCINCILCFPFLPFDGLKAMAAHLFPEVRLFMHNYLASPAAPRALAAVIISLLPQKHKTHTSKTVKSFPLCPWEPWSRESGVRCVEQGKRKTHSEMMRLFFHYFVRRCWHIFKCVTALKQIYSRASKSQIKQFFEIRKLIKRGTATLQNAAVSQKQLQNCEIVAFFLPILFYFPATTSGDCQVYLCE